MLGIRHMELGDVKSYLSPEMGLIQLRESGRTVLFHLNQVWSCDPNTDDQSEASTWSGRPIREQLEEPQLAELLPINTGVRVSHRQLPASPRSPLRSQAIIVIREEERGDDDDNDVLEEFTQRFDASEKRMEFVDELNELHDLFKSIQYPDPDSEHVLDYHKRLAEEEEDFESGNDSEEDDEDSGDDDDVNDDDDDEGESNNLQSENLNKFPEREIGKMSPRTGSSPSGASSEEDTPKNKSAANKDMSDIEEELKSKDLRSLIGTYFDLLQQQNSTSIKNDKLDFATRLQQSSRIKKPSQFFEEFCLALYRKCEDVRKGFKVGSIFVSQVQVNLVLKHGSNIPGHKSFKKDMKSVRGF